MIADNKRREGRVREALPRRSAAGERRRHQQRRRVRRIGRDVQRRARRQADQSVRRVDLAVPHARVLVLQRVAPLQLLPPGLLADPVLLRGARGCVLRPGVLEPDCRGPRPRRRDANGARRYRVRHLADRSVPAPGAVRRRHAVPRGVQRSEPAGRSRRTISSSSSDASCSEAAPTSRSASTSSRRRRCSASSARWRATPCGCPTKSRRTSATRSGARPATSMLATISAWAARDFSRCARKSSRAGVTLRTSSTSAAIRKCADTSTCSSSAPKAGFLNAELRFPFIEAMLTPLGVLGGMRGVLFADMGGARFEGQPYQVVLEAAPSSTRRSWITQFRRSASSAGVRNRAAVDGLRLVDARASYGIGLETFALGFPDALRLGVANALQQGMGGRAVRHPLRRRERHRANCGGSSRFRKAQFAMWIGYDF